MMKTATPLDPPCHFNQLQSYEPPAFVLFFCFDLFFCSFFLLFFRVFLLGAAAPSAILRSSSPKTPPRAVPPPPLPSSPSPPSPPPSPKPNVGPVRSNASPKVSRRHCRSRAFFPKRFLSW